MKRKTKIVKKVKKSTKSLKPKRLKNVEELPNQLVNMASKELTRFGKITDETPNLKRLFELRPNSEVVYCGFLPILYVKY